MRESKPMNARGHCCIGRNYLGLRAKYHDTKVENMRFKSILFFTLILAGCKSEAHKTSLINETRSSDVKVLTSPAQSAYVVVAAQDNICWSGIMSQPLPENKTGYRAYDENSDLKYIRGCGSTSIEFNVEKIKTFFVSLGAEIDFETCDTSASIIIQLELYIDGQLADRSSVNDCIGDAGMFELYVNVPNP